jgi:hypothetical protein
MRPIYVKHQSDLFEFIFNPEGELVTIHCAPNNSASGKFPIDWDDLPPEVVMDYENQLLGRLEDRRYTPVADRREDDRDRSGYDI